jgi:lantibiotic biosynthesis protein
VTATKDTGDLRTAFADGTAFLAQSLAKGAAGTALLHIERAHADPAAWPAAHASIRRATRGPIIASDQAGLFYGAPAISFVIHAAQADGVARYRSAAQTLDRAVTRLAEQRLAAASHRIDHGGTATFAEYDLLYGLTGIAVLMLDHQPGSPVLPGLLDYLARLTEPRPDGTPGWWVSHDPDPVIPTPGGHANLGMAHGAAGILTLLSRAATQGHLGHRHFEAIHRLCDWFDQWAQHSPHGPWWPPWITRQALADGHVTQAGPPRPSWCYGAAGIGRALQLAAIALSDTARQHRAEQAIVDGLADPGPLQLITDAGLCHGIAGVYQAAWRAGRDSLIPTIAQRLPAIAALVHKHGRSGHPGGLLDGVTGMALAMHTAAMPDTLPRTGWDSCLLIA